MTTGQQPARGRSVSACFRWSVSSWWSGSSSNTCRTC